MTRTGYPLTALGKELRALLPTFLASAAAVMLGAFVTFSPARPFVVAAFCWGVIALGAHSIGHEYAHRTLPLLLAQPASRNRILARKALVLTTALLLRFGFTNHRSGEHPPAMVALQATVLLLALTLCLAAPVLAWR